ncbi:MAG: hypothetical protein MMC23_001597 [Stictis urceolatum]|nr:hypothetical protein [Stictis urceolata]
MASSDQYDHAISLVDSTRSSNERTSTGDSLDNAPEPTRTTTGSSSKKAVTRGGTLREEWARRKYARYQEGRYADKGQSSNDDRDSDSGKQKLKKADANRHGRLRDKIPFRSKKPKAAKQREEYAVDVLYENQRGSFFCGIPLYSSNSLLNFDPSAWQTASFMDSPVDITNAQVPDPTWTWAWKRWYVDMSHDVDEEGWEYSFSFNSKFAWHGTHPWLYSFARRRRWLRKRVKIHSSGKHAFQGAMSQGHQLTSDYFTIHAARREGSRDSSVDRSATNPRSSWVGSAAERESVDSSDIEDSEIANIPMLLQRLKRTTIDRKKLDAFNAFLSNAGDELQTLPDAISEILSLFMYQTSRRQALLDLQIAANGLRYSTGSPRTPQTPSLEKLLTSPSPLSPRFSIPRSRSRSPGGNKARQLSALRSAINTIPDSMRELEYWSDAKDLAEKIEGLDFEAGETPVAPQLKMGTRVKEKAGDENVKDGPDPIRVAKGKGAEIKGIPQGAGLDEEVGLVGRLGSGKDRGKRKMKEPRVVCEGHDGTEEEEEHGESD